MQVAPRRLLTRRAAAQLLGVHEETFGSYVRDGKITGARNNGRGRILYDERDVLALQVGKPKSPGPNGGGTRDRKVIPLRGDQLTLDQLVNAGGVDRERAEAASKLLYPYKIVSVKRGFVGPGAQGADDRPIWEDASREDLAEIVLLSEQLDEAAKQENYAQVRKLNTQIIALVNRYKPAWKKDSNNLSDGESDDGGPVRATKESLAQLGFWSRAAA